MEPALSSISFEFPPVFASRLARKKCGNFKTGWWRLVPSFELKQNIFKGTEKKSIFWICRYLWRSASKPFPISLLAILLLCLSGMSSSALRCCVSLVQPHYGSYWWNPSIKHFCGGDGARTYASLESHSSSEKS